MARSALRIAILCSMLIMSCLMLPVALKGGYLAWAQGGTAFIVDADAGAGGIGDWFRCDTGTGVCTSLTGGAGFGSEPLSIDCPSPGRCYVADYDAGPGGTGDWFSCSTSTGACTSVTGGVGFGSDPFDLDVKFLAPVGGEVYAVGILTVGVAILAAVVLAGSAGLGLWLGTRRGSPRPDA